MGVSKVSFSLRCIFGVRTCTAYTSVALCLVGSPANIEAGRNGGPAEKRQAWVAQLVAFVAGVSLARDPVIFIVIGPLGNYYSCKSCSLYPVVPCYLLDDA